MIQLATDPNASRSNRQLAAKEGKEEDSLVNRRRTGHAWPFISRHGEHPARPDAKRTPNTESGS